MLTEDQKMGLLRNSDVSKQAVSPLAGWEKERVPGGKADETSLLAWLLSWVLRVWISSGFRTGIGKLEPTGQICWPIIFVTKVSLANKHAHLFTYCLGQLAFTLRQLRKVVLTQTAWPAGSKHAHCMALYRKSLPTPDLRRLGDPIPWRVTL